MTDATGIGLAFWILSLLAATAILVVGVFALTRTPRTASALWFGIFALAYAASNVGSGLPIYLHAPIDAHWVASTPGALALGLAGAVLPFVFPSRLRPDERGLVALAVAATVLVVATEAFTLWDRPFARVTRQIFEYADVLTEGVWSGALVLFALRFGSEPDPARRRQLALAGAAFALPLAFNTGYLSIALASVTLDVGTVLGRRGLAAAVGAVAFVLIAGLWLRAPSDRRIGRAVAWLSLGLVLSGMLVAAAGWEPWWGLNVLNLVMALTLGYAIFKHRILDLDVTVRFAISKSTVAAAFVVTFFLASEGAQIAFGKNNEWVGLAAAGALVFALAPLQRAAERLATAAVPVSAAAPPPAAPPERREAVFRHAARLAVRGGLTRDEEVHLAELAEELGIGAGRAAALLRDVAREAAAVETMEAP